MDITTEDQFKAYLKTRFFQECSDGELDEVMKLYPNNPAVGSPYGNQPSHKYKNQVSTATMKLVVIR